MVAALIPSVGQAKAIHWQYNWNVRCSAANMKGQKTATLDRRKYDEGFKRQALQMIANGQSVCSVAQALSVEETAEVLKISIET